MSEEIEQQSKIYVFEVNYNNSTYNAHQSSIYFTKEFNGIHIIIFNIYQITDFLSTVVFLTPSRMTSLEYEKIKNYKKKTLWQSGFLISMIFLFSVPCSICNSNW